MSFDQDSMADLLKEVSKSVSSDINTEQIEKSGAVLQQYVSALQKVIGNISLVFLTEEMENYIAEIKESEKLSQSEFEAKYSYEMEICKQLGRAGWVISEYSNPAGSKEWYDLLTKQEGEKIVTYFEGGNGYILVDSIQSLEREYVTEPNQRYFSKAKSFFEQEDYMTTAIYLVILIEARTNQLMNYPSGTRYKQKYSVEGFENYLNTEFKKINSFFTKRFLFLEMYPSIIEFLNRLFIDGKYTFEKKVEPPYINRNWLLHGRSIRTIERYECIQLFNALSVIEFVFSINNRGEVVEE